MTAPMTSPMTSREALAKMIADLKVVEQSMLSGIPRGVVTYLTVPQRDLIVEALHGVAATPTPAFDAMIANLVELDKQRTPGPWRKSHEAIGAPDRHPNGPTNLPLVAECDTDFGMYKTLGPLQAGKNARFIVALENAWPKILATLDSRPDRGEGG